MIDRFLIQMGKCPVMRGDGARYTVLGALGLAIGVALQGTLNNLATCIILVVFRPFHIGDREPAAVERQTG
jgi:hypothetical protein